MVDPAAAKKQAAKEGPVTDKKPPRRRRWFKRFFFLLVLIGIFGWFAPTIIAVKEVRTQLTKLLLPKFSGAIEIGELNLAWMSPVGIKDLKIHDAEGHPLLDVAQISTSDLLWKMASNPWNLGTITVTDPVVHVSIDGSTSNIEQMLSQFVGNTSTPPIETPAAPQSVSGFRPDFIVDIENARIEVQNSAVNRQSTIEPVSLRLVSRQFAVDECDLAVGTPAVEGETSAASDWIVVRYGVSTNDGTTADAANTKHLTLKAAGWKIDRLEALLSRFVPNAEVAGELNADATIATIPSQTGMDWDWTGSIGVHQVLLAGIEAMQRDRLMLEKVEFSGRAAATEGRLVMHDVKLVTDVGQLAATGDVPLDRHQGMSSTELVHSLLSDEDYHLEGKIDLKKLAALVPQTLRIRDGIEIISGNVNVQFASAVDGSRKWSGLADIQGLKAVNQGKTIPWDKPLAVRLNAHRNGESIVVDLLNCNSDFLKVSGKGTMEDAQFTASGDLSKLLENIERFVDLGIEQMTGQMTSKGAIRRSGDNRVELTANILLDNFAYAVTQKNLWTEKHLELSIAATGKTDAKPSLTSLDTGDVRLGSGNDTLELILQSPVDLTVATSNYSAKANLVGGLATWQNRLRPFVAFGDWQLAGSINLQSAVNASGNQINVDNTTLVLGKLEATSPGWLIREPEFKVQAAGKWDVNAKKWTSPKTEATGQAVSIAVSDLAVSIDPKGVASTTGRATYRADLKRVSDWMNLAIPNPTHYLIGSLSGSANLSQQDGTLNADLNATVEKFIIAGLDTGPDGAARWVALWKEPALKLAGQGSYETGTDRLNLTSGRLDVDGLSLAAAGRLDEFSTNQRIDLKGDLAYDWEQLMRRMDPQLAEQFHLTGKDRRPFSIHGALASVGQDGGVTAKSVSYPLKSKPGQTTASTAGGLTDLAGNAGIGWDTATVYGFAVGKGELSAGIERGVCRFAPLDFAVNEGRLHLTPTVYLDRTPYTLELPQEKIFDHLNLTPEICASAIKYVAPLLADTARVDGKISVEMQQASLPLSMPSAGSMGGVLSIHQAQAKPGSVGMQLANVIEQVKSILTRKPAGDPNREQVWIEMPEQRVPFNLVQGRVYHEGMTFAIKNVSLKTRGSVGVDNTLNLVADIPVHDEWLGKDKILAGLKGKTISIPITGTLSQPQVDPAIFENLLRQVGESGLEGVLKDKVGDELNGILNNGLDKLLRNKK